MTFISRSAYLKPGSVGGTLIREVIAFLREQGVQLPIVSDILIATSAGSDSVALAHLLVHYGRKISPRTQISLLHINHRWRANESDQDAEFVRQLGEKWGVPVKIHTLDPPSELLKDSWEEYARIHRKKIYQNESQAGRLILTAHHADDFAETLLWRFCTGAIETHGGGICFSQGAEMRPFLKQRKSKIRDYLQEVGQDYREDKTNDSSRFMRARLRKEVIPHLGAIFPRWVDHLVQLGLKFQKTQTLGGFASDHSNSIETRERIEGLFQSEGIKARRPHWSQLLSGLENEEGRVRKMDLPGGWKLTLEKSTFK